MIKEESWDYTWRVGKVNNWSINYSIINTKPKDRTPGDSTIGNSTKICFGVELLIVEIYVNPFSTEK